MIRTIVSLSRDDKAWLDAYSHSLRQSTAKTIRMAIQYFKKASQKDSYREMVTKTSGIWKNDKRDALDYVRELRKEWDH